jgi:DNA repair exonuclease SbcCD nuclease subunit
MKILCYTDNHFCEKASIVTRYGTKYTTRLENQLQSINWAETLALKMDCDAIICLGDFFDRAQLTDQELTALTDINWANLPHYFLVGNHESEENDLQYSSTAALAGINREIINKPELRIMSDTLEFAFLPYVLESNRVALSEIFSARNDRLRLLFSHNDILGLQLGPVVSKTGYSVEELESCCDLCLNGHLHNGYNVSERVINLGNLTGKDFGENAFKHAHGAVFIDTDTTTFQFIENPHAFNFYKIDIDTEGDIFALDSLKNNAIISMKCKEHLVDRVRAEVAAKQNIIEYRIIITKDYAENDTAEFDVSSLMVDQCAKFAECCRAKLDNNEILEEELAEILK